MNENFGEYDEYVDDNVYIKKDEDNSKRYSMTNNNWNWISTKDSLGTVTQLESSTEPLDDVFFPTVSNHTKVAYPQGLCSI